MAKRINVVGTSGSGKSTFARRLAERAGLLYLELDFLYWKPGWIQPSDEEFFAKVREALADGGWVLDGNYTRTVPIKWENVDLIVWLDFSFGLTLFRALKRAAARAWSKEELWAGTGNRESLVRLFTRDSILWWTIKTHAKNRRRYESCLADPRFAHLRFVRLRSPTAAEEFLKNFRP